MIAEAIRNAQKLTGKKVINGEDMRRGLETLNITEARLEGIGPAELRGADQGDLHRPQRPQRPTWSSGTAPSGDQVPD